MTLDQEQQYLQLLSEKNLTFNDFLSRINSSTSSRLAQYLEELGKDTVLLQRVIDLLNQNIEHFNTPELTTFVVSLKDLLIENMQGQVKNANKIAEITSGLMSTMKEMEQTLNSSVAEYKELAQKFIVRNQ